MKLFKGRKKPPPADPERAHRCCSQYEHFREARAASPHRHTAYKRSAPRRHSLSSSSSDTCAGACAPFASCLCADLQPPPPSPPRQTMGDRPKCRCGSNAPPHEHVPVDRPRSPIARTRRVRVQRRGRSRDRRRHRYDNDNDDDDDDEDEDSDPGRGFDSGEESSGNERDFRCRFPREAGTAPARSAPRRRETKTQTAAVGQSRELTPPPRVPPVDPFTQRVGGTGGPGGKPPPREYDFGGDDDFVPQGVHGTGGGAPDEQMLYSHGTKIERVIEHSMCIARNANQFFDAICANLPVDDMRFGTVDSVVKYYEHIMEQCTHMRRNTGNFTPFWRESAHARPEGNIVASEHSMVPFADGETVALRGQYLQLPHGPVTFIPKYYLCFFAHVYRKDYKLLFKSRDRVDFARFWEQIPRGIDFTLDLKFTAQKFYRATCSSNAYSPEVDLNAHISMRAVDVHAGEYTLYEIASAKLFYVPSAVAIERAHNMLRRGAAGAHRTFAY